MALKRTGSPAFQAQASIQSIKPDRVPTQNFGYKRRSGPTDPRLKNKRRVIT
jgi:hypothetical protein